MQVHTAKKACVAVYPSTVQNNIVWFWPNLDPRYKDILVEKKPPYIPEIDDPSYTNLMGNRDIPYGYDLPLSCEKKKKKTCYLGKHRFNFFYSCNYVWPFFQLYVI